MNVLAFCLALTFCGPSFEPVAAPHEVAAPRPAKAVKVEIIDLEESPSAKVRVGDTLEVTVPLWPGSDWKVVGDQPTDTTLVPGYLSPTVDGLKYTWKIAAPTGKRTIKFVKTDEQDPKAPPETVTLTVTVSG